MNEPTIICPRCGCAVPMSEALTKQIEEQVKERLRSEISAAEARARAEAESALDVTIADLRNQVNEGRTKLKASQEKELEFLKAQRALEDRARELDLEVERQVGTAKGEIEQVARNKVEEEHRIKDLEKDSRLQQLTTQIEELKRKAEQGSQQTQGEVVEVELEEMLARAFPHDRVEPVPKGIRGADAVQRVYHPSGCYCGAIVWESKNTKNWSDGWLAKLKEDQRAVSGECAVLMSVALPPTIKHIGQVDGVWITDLACAVTLASALRSSLIEVAMAKVSLVGKGEKMETLYAYLSGPQFRERVGAVVEAFVSMKKDLDQEKRAMERQWAKREKQIERVVRNMGGMYGDVQGIIVTLPDIEMLELPASAEATLIEDT